MAKKDIKVIKDRLSKNFDKQKEATLRFRHFLLLIFFTILFLFYPGDSYYIKLFSYNRSLFASEERNTLQKINPIPYIINANLYPETTAEGVYIVDVNSFTPIFQKNPNLKLLPASTTKIITALTAFDYYEIDQVLEVKNVINEGQVMGLIHGEKITFENLLYGLLVHSANDAAYVLADNYPGGEKKFIEQMNIKAKEIGMTNSQLKNPAGLDEFNQYTTAFDLSLAGRNLLKINELSKIVSIKSITVSDVDFKYFHALKNINKLLGEIEGIGGLKTGYTEDAGENLVTFYKKNGHNFIISILKSEDRFEDTKKIVDWIDSNIDYINIDIKSE